MLPAAAGCDTNWTSVFAPPTTAFRTDGWATYICVSVLRSGVPTPAAPPLRVVLPAVPTAPPGAVVTGRCRRGFVCGQRPPACPLSPVGQSVLGVAVSGKFHCSGAI